MSSDLRAIERQRHHWIAAVNARDVDRYLDLLTDDIVWLPPGAAALSGKAAFGARGATVL
jgi:ketosteroid isomerase-like protein